MTDQREALRLADFLEDQYDPSHNLEEAAAELRRLHAVNAELLAQQPQTPCDIAEDGVPFEQWVNAPQQEQEPVAWQWLNTACFRKKLPANAEPGAWNPLYAHPPRREWRSLTEEDIQHPHPPAMPVYATAQNIKSVRDGFEMGGYEKEPGYYSEEQLDEFARAIEAKLKEKNHG